MNWENEPSLEGMKLEREGPMDKPRIPTWEGLRNSLQMVDAAERRDLDRRIHAPVEVSPSVIVKRSYVRVPRKKPTPAPKDALRARWKR